MLLIVAEAGAVLSQQPSPLPPLPGFGPSPLLHVRFVGPAGVRVTAYSGALPREFDAPVTIGLRPGYIYRFAIGRLPEQPDVTLYPTIEVRGTLQLPPKQRAADYPAPIVLTGDDIRQALSGVLVTKVIYLENPDRALPEATNRDQALETELRPGQDPLAEARCHGRPMAIVRLGGRGFTPDELLRQAIPGTVLLPGEAAIGPAAAPPYVPWAGMPIYDPYLGPRPPEEECLHDGGDVGLRAGIGPNGKLNGLDPSDTVAEYKDSHGGVHVTRSNRICLCVPRYAAVRVITPPAGYETAVALADRECVQANAQANCRVPSLLAKQQEQLAGLRGRERLSAALATQGPSPILQLEVLRGYDVEIGPAVALCTTEVKKLTIEQRTRVRKQMEFARLVSQPIGTQDVSNVQGPSVVGQVNGVNVITRLQETRDFTCLCNGEPQPPDKPLVLCKWTNVTTAQIGDIVTFYLKFSNQGGQPITDLAVSDSLTARLEYVPGSAKSDRDAVFTMQQNEAGSLILRWEIQGRVLPGQGGVVSFQAKIR
jgi:uncharacterized repeat protein (TIGR01451 family)